MPLYTDTKVPNILHNVMAQGVLARNVVTVDLPNNVGDEGSLTLGKFQRRHNKVNRDV